MADLVSPKPTYETSDDPPSYTAQDALGRSARSAMLTGAAGLFIASVQNTVAKEQIGAFGVFTRFGRTIGLLSTYTRPLRRECRKWAAEIEDDRGIY
jgi:hypothetical protein